MSIGVWSIIDEIDKKHKGIATKLLKALAIEFSKRSFFR